MALDLKQQIIVTATDLFMKQGYVATSTRQLATILNVTQPAIYHHFKSKEEIYTAVLKRFAIEVGTTLQSILDDSRSKRETLIEMALFLKDQHPFNLPLMMHDLEHSLSENTEMEIFLIWRQYYFAPFITYFESIHNTLRKDFTVLTVSQHFLRILSAYISDSYQNEAMNTVKIEDMVDIFLRGISVNSESL